MSKKPHIKRMFAGAITYQGFYSLYNYLIEPNARHIYVIKGGPGVGKSTFMKQIYNEIANTGYDVEMHHCSSDSTSIDGLVIPEIRVALLDGTSPHIVDPKNPGAVDEIINLGEYWDEEIIRKNKDEILNCGPLISREFQAAYFSLKEAKNAMDEWKFYLNPYQKWDKINLMYYDVEKEIFKHNPGGQGKVRHLFAWGHTPEGKIQFIDTLLKGINTLYLLKGQPGTGKSTFLRRIADRAQMLGINAEIYHSPLDPEKYDLVILPSLSTAFVISSELYPYIPELDGEIKEFNLDEFIEYNGLKAYVEDINICRERISNSIARAILHARRAKSIHDKLESYYIPAMKFKEIENKRQLVLEEILNMIK